MPAMIHFRFVSNSLLALAITATGMLPGTSWGERGPAPRPPAIGSESPVEARVIVKYKAESTLMRSLSARPDGSMRPQHAATLSQRLRLPLEDGRVLGRRTQGLRATGMSSATLAAQLSAMPDVEWAVVDQRRRISALTSDPLLADNQPTATPLVGQWYLRAPAGVAVSSINAVGAWDLTPGSSAITVAILDTGVLSSHPDLAGKLHPGYDFVHDPVTANDGDGRDADPSDPGDWTTVGECGLGEKAANSSWHGTQVAGLIGAATDNGLGVASVGRNIMLLPVRVLGRCGGFDSDIIAAMRWSAGLSSDVGFGTTQTIVNTHPARVINLSLGAVGACPASYRDVVAELKAASVTVVAAAGNQNGVAVNSPANCAGVIAVAGLRHVGTKVGYSSIGPEVAIAAPAGNCVNTSGTCLYPLVTTTNAGTTTPGANIFSDGGANASLGTSFSSPLVAGTAGLMLSLNPSLTPAGIKAALQSSARPFPTTGGEVNAPTCRAPDGVDQIECYCTTSTCGAGMLNTLGAVARAFDPTVSIVASTASTTAGSAVALDGSATVAYGGRSIASYQWSILAGASLASFSGPTNGASATLVTSAAGTVTVRLSVSDSSGVVAVDSTSIGIAPAPVVQPPAASGGGGGGAPGRGWALAGLAMLAAALWSRRKERDSRQPGV